MRLFSNRSQKTSKCGKNISDTLGYRLVCHLFCSCHILTSSVNRRTATWNLLVNLKTVVPIYFEESSLTLFDAKEVEKSQKWRCGCRCGCRCRCRCRCRSLLNPYWVFSVRTKGIVIPHNWTAVFYWTRTYHVTRLKLYNFLGRTKLTHSQENNSLNLEWRG